jgi:hypothetical protein
MGNGQFNMVATSSGDMIVGDKSNLIKFNMSLTSPMVLSDDNDKLAHLHSSDEKINKSWCAAKKTENGNGKVVWSSFFLMDYDNTEKWNNLVLDQIDWLLK